MTKAAAEAGSGERQIKWKGKECKNEMESFAKCSQCDHSHPYMHHMCRETRFGLDQKYATFKVLKC